MIEVILPKSCIDFIIILVIEDSKALSSLRRNSLSSIDEAIFIL